MSAWEPSPRLRAKPDRRIVEPLSNTFNRFPPRQDGHQTKLGGPLAHGGGRVSLTYPEALAAAFFMMSESKFPPSSDNGDSDESDRSIDFASDRPAKRRKVSREGIKSMDSDASEEQRQDDGQCQQSRGTESAIKAECNERAHSPRSIPAVTSPQSTPFSDKPVNCEAETNITMEDTTEEEHAPGPPVKRRSAKAVSSASKPTTLRKRLSLQHPAKHSYQF